MKLIIRGHIRNAFETDQLCHLVQRLCVLFPTLTLFIHTWNVFANDLSHRHIRPVWRASIAQFQGPLLNDEIDHT